MADGEERGRPSARPSGATGLSHVVGRLVGWQDGIGPQVAFEGAQGRTPARTIVPLDAAVVTAAIAEGRDVLLVLDGGRIDAPIIVGLLEPDPRRATPEAAAVEATIDGQRVVVCGKDEIVLQCGLSSITLRRNGRIVIRGVEIESRARGTNKIRGGSVLIN
jgi:hypothetical protein